MSGYCYNCASRFGTFNKEVSDKSLIFYYVETETISLAIHVSHYIVESDSSPLDHDIVVNVDCRLY